MLTPIHTPGESATALGALFCLLWLVILIGWLVGKSHAIAETVAWFRRKAVPAKIFIVCAFCAVLTYGSIKSGGNEPQGMRVRPPAALSIPATRPEAAYPCFAPVSVYTNGVILRAKSTNAVEITAFRTIGGTEIGDWIETVTPFFAVGTNRVSRCYVSASGSVSFESHRRPPVGSALPDGTGLPVLCPLRAHLGMVPEANWTNANAQSRFWHDSLPGGGRVLTWENALVDRLPGRRVSLQVEMRPTGDNVFRYAFHDELNPPATNFVMGAQMGTNGVNALSILGTNILAATDWAETFVWRTDPNHADTDGDGTADNVELMMGANPFDSDEDGDGVPDGTSTATWTGHPLWAANSTNAANVRITLQSSPLESATLVIGSLSIPLGEPASGCWSDCDALDCSCCVAEIPTAHILPRKAALLAGTNVTERVRFSLAENPLTSVADWTLAPSFDDGVQLFTSESGGSGTNHLENVSEVWVGVVGGNVCEFTLSATLSGTGDALDSVPVWAVAVRMDPFDTEFRNTDSLWNPSGNIVGRPSGYRCWVDPESYVEANTIQWHLRDVGSAIFSGPRDEFETSIVPNLVGDHALELQLEVYHGPTPTLNYHTYAEEAVVPLRMIVVCDDDGSPPPNHEVVTSWIDMANLAFSQAAIRFQWDDTVMMVTNSDWYAIRNDPDAWC